MKINTIKIDRDETGKIVDVTFTFVGPEELYSMDFAGELSTLGINFVKSREPYSAVEFVKGSKTRIRLDKIVSAISDED